MSLWLEQSSMQTGHWYVRARNLTQVHVRSMWLRRQNFDGLQVAVSVQMEASDLRGRRSNDTLERTSYSPSLLRRYLAR